MLSFSGKMSNVSFEILSSLDFRGWWTPMLFTAGIASAKYFYTHFSRRNTLTQARRNISRHYDLAKVEKSHEILEIGCGWGGLAIEVVRHTGCKYTGITLSKEQLRFAEIKVKEAGFQDRIKFLLCDYRQMPHLQKYDRIISCEMLEAVGHEYMEDFFHCCDSLLADNGLLVLQFISIPDERYDEYRQSSDFMKEYIFPGGCLPSLSRVTSAMAAASKLCVEHVENIGIHYYQTLRYWRKNFLEKQRKFLTLGFNEKFIRTWEYYFDYYAAGFKSRTLGNYQVVFSRPGNVVTFNDDLYEEKRCSHKFDLRSIWGFVHVGHVCSKGLWKTPHHLDHDREFFCFRSV